MSLKRLDPFFDIPDMTYGVDFTIQSFTNNFRRKKWWHCNACGYEWKGIKRLHRLHKTPTRCPKCTRWKQIVQVKK